MKVEECILKTRVALVTKTINRYDAPSVRYGHIAGLTSVHPTAGERVIVEWDSGHLDKIVVKDLVTEKEAQDWLLQQEAERISLESEFQKIKASIEDKIKVATSCFIEASTLAKSIKLSLRYDFENKIYPLEEAIERAGWSTSSWHC